mmetsp:Transcript_57985/g.138057  ORF Transcript_57985/g.138057 Transcript_57985/m.138057 type:complete len:281 (+) Transcript_57985:19-861(+)
MTTHTSRQLHNGHRLTAGNMPSVSDTAGPATVATGIGMQPQRSIGGSTSWLALQQQPHVAAASMPTQRLHAAEPVAAQGGLAAAGEWQTAEARYALPVPHLHRQRPAAPLPPVAVLLHLHPLLLLGQAQSPAALQEEDPAAAVAVGLAQAAAAAVAPPPPDLPAALQASATRQRHLLQQLGKSVLSLTISVTSFCRCCYCCCDVGAGDDACVVSHAHASFFDSCSAVSSYVGNPLQCAALSLPKAFHAICSAGWMSVADSFLPPAQTVEVAAQHTLRSGS